MKNAKVLSVILAIVLVFGITALSLTACDTGGGGDGGGGSPIVISGTLGGGNMLSVSASVQKLSGEVQSSNSIALAVNTDGQIFRGEVQKDNSITGKLEDGAFIYNLNGSYDPASKAFTMQAASGTVVFSIDGKLNSGGNIVTNESKATLHNREGSEWKTYEYAITPGDHTIGGEVNQSGGAEIPAWGRGTWFDRMTGTQIVVDINYLWVYYPNGLKNKLAILEIKNPGANSATLVAKGKPIGTNKYFYTQFYCANLYDSTLSSAIGNNYLPYPLDNVTVSDVVNNLPAGQKVFVAPYCSNDSSKVHTAPLDTIYGTWNYTDTDGYSPLFNTEANAIAATVLRVIPDYTLALMKTRP